jgi:hypothetical protein
MPFKSHVHLKMNRAKEKVLLLWNLSSKYDILRGIATMSNGISM